MEYRSSVLVDGLGFPEDPRWRGEQLWFSDMDAKAVMCVGLNADLEKVVEVAGTPSGLGWLPDGDLVVVSMQDRRLLQGKGTDLVERANLWDFASFHCNDMMVTGEGRAFIGNFGFDFEAMDPFAPGEIITVSPDRSPKVAAEGLAFPNGIVTTPDEKTLIVSETLGERLTAFDIGADGELTNRRTWADLKQMTPDGITMDVEGAVWVASPVSGGVFRVKEGGEITDVVRVESQAYSCSLGGEDGRTLFMTTSDPLPQLFEIMNIEMTPESERKEFGGRIEYCEVEFPGLGRP